MVILISLLLGYRYAMSLQFENEWYLFLWITFIEYFSASVPPASEFISDGYGKAVINHYEMLTSFPFGCLLKCKADFNCNGFSTNISHCFLSKCNKYIDVQCLTCFFGRRLNPTNTVSCPLYTSSSMPVTMASWNNTVETTQLSRNISLSSFAYGTENNSNIALCRCVCKNVSHTLNESIEIRRNELRVNKTLLASTIRRRTSASDSRMSSRLIGAVGVIIIVLFGMLIICSDIFSVFYFKSKTFKALFWKKNIIINIIYWICPIQSKRLITSLHNTLVWSYYSFVCTCIPLKILIHIRTPWHISFLHSPK